jgi:hypothetical protein
MAAVLKTAEVEASVGSNPTLSSTAIRRSATQQPGSVTSASVKGGAVKGFVTARASQHR